MDEKTRELIIYCVERNKDYIEANLNDYLRKKILKPLGIPTTDLDALSQAQRTFNKIMTGHTNED